MRTGTREWADSTCNIQLGCEHGCHYCYAKAMACRFGRCTPAEWATPVLAPPRTYGKRRGRIMFPSTHDITPANLDECYRAVEGMLRAGNEVLVVSKPHHDVVDCLCQGMRWARDLLEFRFTIGSARPAVLSFWEPGAPQLGERMSALSLAANMGFRCSVSVEPMLDCEPGAVVLSVAPVVETVWLGRANNLKVRLAMNDAPDEVQLAGQELMRAQSDGWIRALYALLKNNPQVRWKDSIRRVVGLPPAEGAQ